MFSTLPKININFLNTSILSSGNALNLDRSEILPFGKGSNKINVESGLIVIKSPKLEQEIVTECDIISLLALEPMAVDGCKTCLAQLQGMINTTNQ